MAIAIDDLSVICAQKNINSHNNFWSEHLKTCARRQKCPLYTSCYHQTPPIVEPPPPPPENGNFKCKFCPGKKVYCPREQQEEVVVFFFSSTDTFWSWFLRRFRSDLTRSLLVLKNELGATWKVLRTGYWAGSCRTTNCARQNCTAERGLQENEECPLMTDREKGRTFNFGKMAGAQGQPKLSELGKEEEGGGGGGGVTGRKRSTYTYKRFFLKIDGRLGGGRVCDDVYRAAVGNINQCIWKIKRLP